MQTIQHRYLELSTSYPLHYIAPPEDILLIDIETTGFSPKTSYLYMVGCLYFDAGSFHTIQWFADSYEDEQQIISSFFRFSKPYHYLVHFNGNQFDLPYLTKKIEHYHISETLQGFESIDIYKRIMPFKQILSLDHLKQKSIETFLHMERTDCYDGGQLISIFHEFVKEPTDFNRDLLLLHNFDDLKGMLRILPILSYYDLFHKSLTIDHAERNEYEDFHAIKQQELLLTGSAFSPLPVDISYNKNDCRIVGCKSEIKLRIPLYHQELKYFLPNYKEYYYLPMEDSAIHKSVAAYVDRNHRIPATPATCYTKKEGDYLPQWKPFIIPEFKKDYRDKASYFLFEDSLLKDHSFLQTYVQHLMDMFLS